MLTFNERGNILSEKEKNNEDLLINIADLAISELVIEKDYLRKAYNYYDGERDKDQFKHLEENFGIGNPTAIEFVPLIKRHIDVLVGEHLQNKFKPKITCKDVKTLKQIDQDKSAAKMQGEYDILKRSLTANIYHAIHNKDKEYIDESIHNVEQDLAKLKSNIDKNFISEFEIAAQNILTHLKQSKQVDLTNKLKMLFLDLLIAGQCFYKVKNIYKGATPEIEVLSPFDVFFDANGNTPYIKDSQRIVIRRWMYIDQILNRYGEHLDKDHIKALKSIEPGSYINSNMYVRGGNGNMISTESGAVMDTSDVTSGEYGSFSNIHNLIPVYEVEWLSANPEVHGDKRCFRMDRYKVTRIADSIYLDMGKDEDVIRSAENPYAASCSVNGIYYNTRGKKPYSLVLATANLQDKYDVLHFYRDTLIANSGVKGDFLDVAQLPTFLGQNPAERILKWKAYKKAGTALINTAQEGRGANHNTIYSGFDDTVSGQSIQAIELAIQRTEETCSSVTGVFRERLGGIEQKDAVTNVAVGVKQSAIITKQYYQVMDTVTNHLLIDSINACKIAYADGIVGSIILDDSRQKIFTVEPRHFAFTDYDISIGDSGEIMQQMQKIEAITMELIKGGAVDVDIVFEGITTESLTDMKTNVLEAVAKRKEENNQLNQLQQQLQQAQQQMQELKMQAQKMQIENDQLKNQKIDLETKRVEYTYELGKEANKNAREFNDEKIKLDRARVELEKVQLYDDNAENDEIKNV